MRALYHFRQSPFSRRARLALAHKQLAYEARDARETPTFLDEARRLVPLHTLPVFVDSDRALGDSTAIAHWLDRAYPQAPRLWPDGDEAHSALEVTTHVDVVLNTTVDVATRYFPLRSDAAWGAVRDNMLARVRSAFDALARRASAASTATIAKSGWSVADMWLFTAVSWFERLPARVGTHPNIAQVLSLGIVVPRALSAWADGHRARPDVLDLG